MKQEIIDILIEAAKAAGEVFSVGFMDEYLKTNGIVKAVAFGNACASFKITDERYDYEKAKQRAEEILKNL